MNWLVRGALHTLWYWEAALVLVLAASALLLWSGLRGKRKGTTPYCRRCDYNLTALDRPICPECGADLRPRRAIVVGERHRRYGRLAMVPFALFAASYIVVGPLEPVWSFWDWYACSSFASLTSDLRGSSRAYRALRELRVRWDEHSLSANQEDIFLELLLSAKSGQRPAAAIHDLAIGEFDSMVRSQNARRLQPGHLRRYLETHLSFELSCRKAVETGRTIPLRLAVGLNFTNMSPYRPYVDRPVVQVNKRDVSDSIRWRWNASEDCLLSELPAQSAGVAKIEVDLRCKIYDGGCLEMTEVAQPWMRALYPLGAPTHPSSTTLGLQPKAGAKPACEYTSHLVCTSRICPAGDCSEVRSIPVDLGGAVDAPDYLFLRTSRSRKDPGKWLIEGHFRFDGKLAADLAFEAFVIMDNDSIRLDDGAVLSATRGSAPRGVRLDVSGSLPRRPPSRVDLILRGSTDAALATVNIDTTGEGEIRLEGVPVETCDAQEDVLW